MDRFWKMMEMFSENETVSRSILIRKIFKDHPLELDSYERDNIISYTLRDVFNSDTVDVSTNSNSNSNSTTTTTTSNTPVIQSILQHTSSLTEKVTSKFIHKSSSTTTENTTTTSTTSNGVSLV